MQTTDGMTLRLTTHAMRTAMVKGFKAKAIQKTFNQPKEIYASKSHPGQFRITGNGICIVGIPEGDKFVGITMYADRVITPPRPDQMDTAVGRRYAERYEQGLGRG